MKHPFAPVLLAACLLAVAACRPAPVDPDLDAAPPEPGEGAAGLVEPVDPEVGAGAAAEPAYGVVNGASAVESGGGRPDDLPSGLQPNESP